MIEETQEGPKWLKELEEKREKRVKARLGHEAGAGSPCLTCEEKCPGLDLHFWRKICKNCKCGKENHDVNDDDIYGWAQFQLLGSKPNKPKKMVIPGRKDAVELEWAPKGQTEVVESYLKDLPVNLLPIKGSAAAQERKQLLQKQIPLHDIDPTLCHALSENEIKQMNDYIAHVKQNSVGVGHIMKLNELLKNRHSANAQILSSRAPMQVPQVENIILQGMDRTNALKLKEGSDFHKGLRDLSLDELKSRDAGHSEQVSSKLQRVRDIVYGTYHQDIGGNDYNVTDQPNLGDFSVVSQHNRKNMQQNPENMQGYLRNLQQGKNMGVNVENFQQNPQNFQHNLKNLPENSQLTEHNLKKMQQEPENVDYNLRNLQHGRNLELTQENLENFQQNPQNFELTQHNLKNLQENLQNIQLPQQNLKNMQFPQQPIANQIDHQNSTNIPGVKDIKYPCGVRKIPNMTISGGNAHKTPSFANQNIDSQQYYEKIDFANPPNYENIRDIHYPDNSHVIRPKDGIPGNYSQIFAKNLPHYANSSIMNTENTQKPLEYDIRNVYPDMNVNFEPHLHVGDSQSNPEHLDNVLNLKGDPKMPHYIPGRYNTFIEQQNPQKIGNITDLAYSTYDPSHNLDRNNENLQKYGRPANYNPNEINLIEQNQNPTSINVGIINDIEYPTIKSAIQRENNIFEPALPRKNVQFDLNPQEILPSCHKCKKMFESTAIVIGIDHTDDLWHADCFKCTGCNQNLADLMYFYHKESDDIYCGRDYAKIRGIPRCQACDELIFVKEYCLAENSTFHVKHFCCFECDEPLAGQNYVMEESQPLCLPCFEKVKAEKCNTCLKVIKPDEQGANLNGVHFHADDGCFACKMCKKPLLGAKLLFKNNNLYCSAPCFGADK